MPKNTEPASTLSRRSVAQGALWAAPVVTVAASAPVLAASTVECPTMPASTSGQWTDVRSGRQRDGANDRYGFNADGLTWRVFDDNFYDRSDSNAVETLRHTKTTLETVPGAVYTMEIETWWQNAGGNNQPTSSEKMRAQVLINGVSVFNRLTDTGINSNGLGVTPGEPSRRTWTITFTATGPTTTFEMGGSALIRGRQSNSTEFKAANDDINISFVAFTSCEPASA